MSLLLVGMALFFGIHVAIAVSTGRRVLTSALGENGRKGATALLSFAGLGLMIWGYRAAPFTEVYEPLGAARSIAHALMPLAFIMLAGAHAPSNMKRYLRHPMSLAVLTWALVHLSANGDLASVLLFGAFGAYALLDIFVTGRAGPPPPQRPRVNDLIAVVIGMVAYGAALWIHGPLLGVYVTG